METLPDEPIVLAESNNIKLSLNNLNNSSQSFQNVFVTSLVVGYVDPRNRDAGVIEPGLSNETIEVLKKALKYRENGNNTPNDSKHRRSGKAFVVPTQSKNAL